MTLTLDRNLIIWVIRFIMWWPEVCNTINYHFTERKNIDKTVNYRISKSLCLLNYFYRHTVGKFTILPLDWIFGKNLTDSINFIRYTIIYRILFTPYFGYKPCASTGWEVPTQKMDKGSGFWMAWWAGWL